MGKSAVWVQLPSKIWAIEALNVHALSVLDIILGIFLC